jgi:hypothetical protein
VSATEVVGRTSPRNRFARVPLWAAGAGVSLRAMRVLIAIGGHIDRDGWAYPSLRGAPEVLLYGWGTITSKRLVAPDSDAVDISIARHRTGEHRIYAMRWDPYEGPRLLLRLVWGNGEPLMAKHLEPGDWIDRLPPPRAKGEPQKFNTMRERPWQAR